jgi:hypothetical protein
MRSHLLGFVAVVVLASAAQAAPLLIAAYDGNTANGGKNADIAVGNPAPTVLGTSTINNVNFKYGGGALDTTTVTSGGNGLRYSTANNFNPQAGTVEMWIRVPGYTGATRQELFSIFAGGFTGDFSLFLDNTQGGRLRAVVDANGVNQWVQTGFQNGAYFGDGNFHHVAWNWDTSAGFSTLYVDGVAETFNHTGTVAFGGTLGTTMEIGSRQGGFDALRGQIDDIRISNNAVYGQVGSFTPPGPHVPEPSALGALAIGALAMVGRRRRQY